MNDEKEKKEELETEYKDIEEKYRRELITLKVSTETRVTAGVEIDADGVHDVQTAEMANQDLEKLQKALDGYAFPGRAHEPRLHSSDTSWCLIRAIMRFHGLKMKEINDTIADLWTKTYQGTGQ